MQDQIQEAILDSPMAKQDRLEYKDYANRLASTEAKLENRSISSHSNPLYIPYQ